MPYFCRAFKCSDIFFLTLRGGSKRSRGIFEDSLNNEMSKWFPIPITSQKSAPVFSFKRRAALSFFIYDSHPSQARQSGRPPRGLLLNRRPAQPGGGLRAPLGPTSPGSPGVTWSLAPARSSRTAAVQTGDSAPSGFPGPSPGYEGVSVPRRPAFS